MKRFVAVVLMVGVISNCFNYLLLEQGYHFNKSYISSVLCTNKDKIGRHCEGKCFLDIKLKELEQKNRDSQQNLKRTVETFTAHVLDFPRPNMVEYLAKHNFPHQVCKPISRSIPIFQPPRLVSFS